MQTKSDERGGECSTDGLDEIDRTNKQSFLSLEREGNQVGQMGACDI